MAISSEDEAILRQARRDLEEALPLAPSGPVNSLLAERACNIGVAALDRLRTALQERDEALALLAEAWEWTTPSMPGKLGYVALRERVTALLRAGGGKEGK